MACPMNDKYCAESKNIEKKGQNTVRHRTANNNSHAAVDTDEKQVFCNYGELYAVTNILKIVKLEEK